MITSAGDRLPSLLLSLAPSGRLPLIFRHDRLFAEELGMRLLIRQGEPWIGSLDTEPIALKGPAILFRTQENAGDDGAWRQRCPDTEIFEIPGDHRTISEILENSRNLKTTFAPKTIGAIREVLPQCNAWLIHKPIHLLTGSSIGGCSRPLALSSLTRTAAVWAYGSASGRDRSPRNDTMGRSGHWRRAEGYRIIRPRQISRVEDGRGGCAPRRPFPVPAHQTGRADFQHPAFRPASSYDPRRASIVRAHKMQNRKFSKHITKGEP